VPLHEGADALLLDREALMAQFANDANFCASRVQRHVHSPTCTKYSWDSKTGARKDGACICRFGCPWKLVERTRFNEEGVLEIRRADSRVNRWNDAMAVGLRHNHDVSFIGTKKKGHALIYYLTNYATKVEDTMWKRISILRQVYEENKASLAESAAEGDAAGLPAESFLLKVANRLFTERSLSMVEVVSFLLGQPTEYSSTRSWTYLNAASLYKSVYATGRLRPSHAQNREVEDDEEGGEADRHEEESPVYLTRLGKKLQWWQAYPFRGEALRNVCLYDYLRLVRFVRVKTGNREKGRIPFAADGPAYGIWTQVLRKPEYEAELSINGYLYTDFGAVIDDGIPM